jgi:hypothetical protein
VVQFCGKFIVHRRPDEAQLKMLEQIAECSLAVIVQNVTLHATVYDHPREAKEGVRRKLKSMWETEGVKVPENQDMPFRERRAWLCEGETGKFFTACFDALARIDFGPEPLKASVFDDGPADRSGARGRDGGRRARPWDPASVGPGRLGLGRAGPMPAAAFSPMPVAAARAPLRERSPSLFGNARPGSGLRGSGLYGSPSSHGRLSGADRARRQSSLSGMGSFELRRQQQRIQEKQAATRRRSSMAPETKETKSTGGRRKTVRFG